MCNKKCVNVGKYSIFLNGDNPIEIREETMIPSNFIFIFFIIVNSLIII